LILCNNQAINQAFTQPTKQSNNHSVTQLTMQSLRQPTNQTITQPINQPNNHSANQSTKQSLSQPINKTITQPSTQPNTHAANQLIIFYTHFNPSAPVVLNA
jgi:hypothetical protein